MIIKSRTIKLPTGEVFNVYKSTEGPTVTVDVHFSVDTPLMISATAGSEQAAFDALIGRLETITLALRRAFPR